MNKNKLIKSDDIKNLKFDDVKAFYSDHISRTKVNLLSNFEFGGEEIEYAEGIFLHTKSGKLIYDFTGGFGVLNHGHNHPKILAVRKKFNEEKNMEVYKNYISPYTAVLAYNISRLLPGDLNNCFFPNSGSEAIDSAMKTAYKYHDLKRPIILYSDIAFHGKLLGSNSISSSPENNFDFPKIPNTISYKFNDLNSVIEIIDKYRSNNSKSLIAAIFVEPINISNLRECSKSFLVNLRKICLKEDILLIFDEIYSGWNKTGPLFYFMRYKHLVPDILCSSKAIGGGKSSISAVITTKKIHTRCYESTEYANLQSSTYFSFAEESLTAIEAINICIDEKFEIKSKNIEKQLLINLVKLKNKYPKIIQEIRGVGSIFGIFFKSKLNGINKIIKYIPSKLFKDENFVNKLITVAIIDYLYKKHNVLTFTSLGKEIHLIVSPPLIVKKNEIDYFFKSLDETLSNGIIKLIILFISSSFLDFKKQKT